MVITFPTDTYLWKSVFLLDVDNQVFHVATETDHFPGPILSPNETVCEWSELDEVCDAQAPGLYYAFHALLLGNGGPESEYTPRKCHVNLQIPKRENKC